jgi:hypothetical protein
MGAVATWMTPHGRGFDTSLGYLSGGEDHYTQIQKGNIFGGVGVDFYKTDAPAYGLNGTYACYTYNDAILETLAMAEHTPSTKLFLYIALQVMHAPEQVTAQFQSLYSSETYTSNYAGAMRNNSHFVHELIRKWIKLVDFILVLRGSVQRNGCRCGFSVRKRDAVDEGPWDVGKYAVTHDL